MKIENRKKDVVFLCQYFFPETISSAALSFDMAEYLAEKGLSVGALCGYPKEYSEEKRIPKNETVHGIDVQRIRYLNIKRAKKIGRLINYFSFAVSALLNIRKLKNYKSIIVTSAPPIIPFVALLASILFGTKIIFVSYDVYPEIAVSMGALSDSSLIVSGMQWINKKLFEKASLVVALTDEMREYLLEHRPTLTEDRIITISNWAHEESDDTSNYEGNLDCENDCFSITYFGTMGVCQEMNTILEAAERLKDHDNIKFIFAGHGTKKQAIKDAVQEKHLTNVAVRDFLTGESLAQAIEQSSCFVVSLEAGIRGMCAPSKYYSYLYGGRPIIAIIEQDSYLAEEIEYEGIGVAINIGDTERLVKAILNMEADKTGTAEMGARARKLYYLNYSKQACLREYYYSVNRVIGIKEMVHN